jgi:hypothetical protein
MALTVCGNRALPVPLFGRHLSSHLGRSHGQRLQPIVPHFVPIAETHTALQARLRQSIPGLCFAPILSVQCSRKGERGHSPLDWLDRCMGWSDALPSWPLSLRGLILILGLMDRPKSTRRIPLGCEPLRDPPGGSLPIDGYRAGKSGRQFAEHREHAALPQFSESFALSRRSPMLGGDIASECTRTLILRIEVPNRLISER